jgi:agmatinase
MDGRIFLGDESIVEGEKRISIISAPLANTLSWRGGTDQGPDAILSASVALETFDDELRVETVAAGIETLPPLQLDGLTSEQGCETICRAVDRELNRGRLPVVLGGEHTVSFPAIAACARKHPDLHVLQFDAHLDLRDRYDATPLSHACVMHRIAELNIPFTQVGIRSFSQKEWEMVGERGWKPFYVSSIRSRPDWIAEVCNSISGPLYITFDVDCLDPSIMPATGTPEPDGLHWREVTALLRAVISRNQVVGLDFVELSPAKDQEHAAFLVAKLLYRSLGYIFYDQLKK